MAELAVVVPLYNGARFIAATIASVLDQTHPIGEVFVVDDGSSDGGARIARGFPGVNVLRNPAKGSCSARQHGFEAVTSPYVAFVDHDDIWHPRHAELMLDAIDARGGRTGAAGVFCPLVYFDDGRDPRFAPVDATQPARAHDVWPTFPFTAGPQSPSAVVLSTERLRAAGGWPTWRRSPTDIYMWFRLGIGDRFVRAPNATVAYRNHRRSLSKQLLLRRPADFSGDLRFLLRDALDRFSHARPADPASEVYERRLAALCDLLTLIDVLRGAAAVPIAELARRLGAAMDGDDVAREHFPKFLRYRISGLLLRDGAARAALLRAYVDWPADARASRDRLLGPVIGRTLTPGAVLGAVATRPRALRGSGLRGGIAATYAADVSPRLRQALKAFA